MWIRWLLLELGIRDVTGYWVFYTFSNGFINTTKNKVVREEKEKMSEFKIGDPVEVRYPHDTNWFNVKAVIVDLSFAFCEVQKANGKKLVFR